MNEPIDAIPDRNDLLRRARNMLSHPRSWWEQSAECRSKLIGELDQELNKSEPSSEHMVLENKHE